MDVTPTFSTAVLSSKLPMPASAPMPEAATSKSAADFLQVLAATHPADTGNATLVSAKPGLAPVATVALSTAAYAPTKTVAGYPQVVLKSLGTLQPAGGKRGKKPADEITQAESTQAGPAVVAPPQQSATAVTTAAGAQMEKITAQLPLAAALPALQPPVPEPVQTTAPAAPVIFGNLKPTPAIILKGDQQIPTAAASVKTVGVAAVTPDIPLNPLSIAATHTAPALNVTAKAAEIIKQIAAALPATSLAHSPASTGLHISLNPGTLGTITVKISEHASGETTIILSASQPDTLAALKHDAQSLNQVLTNAGIPEANRQIDFKIMPAAQINTGLDNASGQPASTGGQSGQGNANGQPQQSGTAFANLGSKPTAAPVESRLQQQARSNPRGKVDVIA
jgi:hypothetical protein